MMVRLSKEEMLREWKARRGMTPVSTSTLQVTRRESETVDEMVQREIDDWYAHLLATADPMFLPQRDFSAVTEPRDAGDGNVEIELPEECVRLLSVRMSGWRRPARIVDDADGALARMQSSRYVSGKSCNPVAVRCGRCLTLYSKCGEGKVTELLCVAAPADGSYEFERGELFGIGEV